MIITSEKSLKGIPQPQEYVLKHIFKQYESNIKHTNKHSLIPKNEQKSVP